MKGTNMTQIQEPQTWYTLSEAQTYTRLSESLLRQHVANGQLKSSRSSMNGGKLLFHKRWLDDLIYRHEASNE